MRKVEQAMIRAVHMLIGSGDSCASIRCSDNTVVEQTHHGIAHTSNYQRIISVRLHGNEIAAIRPIEGTVWVSDCGWQTATTKSRINAIIHTFTRHSGVVQHKHEWLRITPTGARYAWQGRDVFPLKLDADNHYVSTYLY
jgi:hypothetical protein